MDSILLFDLETTGTDFINDRIIEFGAVYIVKKNNEYIVEKEIDILVNIGYSLSSEISNLTHITDEMLINEGISEWDLYQLIKELINEDTLLVAYNIQFDINFLMNLFRRYDNKKFIVKNPILDVLAIYKDRFPFPHRLRDAIDKYEVSIANTHRAIDDIKATLLVLEKMKEEKNNIEKYINVVGFNSNYGIAGEKLPHVLYLNQYGGRLEIENL